MWVDHKAFKKMTRVLARCFLLGGLAAMLWSNAYAYEEATHRLLTGHAVVQSALERDPTVLQNLGIERGIGARFPGPFIGTSTITELIRIGSAFEDGGPMLQFGRVTRHFYNPLTGRGMDAGAFPNQTPSPDWALAGVGQLTGQENSYWNAREAFLQALTSTDRAARERHFGLMFRTLGHVIHHLQDMAQPQHVRDDVHCGFLPACAASSLPYRPSLYEAWTSRDDVRAVLTLRLDPGFAGYNITAPSFVQTFNSPRRFWHTEPPSPASPSNGKGMAEFTNRNFVSSGTNFGQSSSFLLPALDPTRRTDLSIGELCSNSLIPCSSELLARSEARLTFFGSLGQDNYLGSIQIPFLATSTESIFDQYLEPTPGGQRIFALNRFNFDEFYNYLIPRAVAFSAGMINYFFRGKLGVEPDGVNEFIVKNLSAEAMQGKFALYYDDSQGNRTSVPLTRCLAGAGEVPPQEGVCKGVALASVNTEPGARLTISFTPPSGPKPKAYMLVFSGDLGEEKADADNGVIGAVVGKFIEPPFEGFLVTPSYAPADGFGGVRLIERSDGQWELKAQTGLVAGNVDWKGWYVNGKPTQALSWRGFRTRYFQQPNTPSPFTPNIYYQGNLFAVAPGPVLGAAMSKDPSGNVWLVAVVGFGFSDEVYRRPFRASTSDALFHPQTAPEGWQLITTYTPTFARQDAWFFNGAGTEAQRLVAHPFQRSARLTLTLNVDGSAQGTVTNIPRAAGPVETTRTVPWEDGPPPPPTTGICRIGENDESDSVMPGGFFTGSTDLTINERPLGLARVLGIDYLDGQELVAEMTTAAVAKSGLIGWEQIVAHTVCRPECSAGGFFAFDSLPETRRGRGHTFSEGSTMRRIAVGGTIIEIHTFGRLDSVSESVQVTDVRRCVNPPTSVVRSQSSTSSATTESEANYFYIAFMDLRVSTAAIYRHHVKRLNQQPPEHSELVEIHSPGGKQTHTLATLTGPPPGCAAASDCDNGPAELDTGGFLPSWYDVGYATDLEGNQAYSLRIVSRVIPPLNQNKIFNSLTGGSLPQVIPIAPPSATYYPIGVFK